MRAHINYVSKLEFFYSFHVAFFTSIIKGISKAALQRLALYYTI